MRSMNKSTEGCRTTMFLQSRLIRTLVLLSFGIILSDCGRSDPILCTDKCENPGDTRCNGVVLQTCAETARHCTQWRDWVDCSYYDQVCRESGGTAECSKTCSDNCGAEGDTRCDGTVIQACALGEKGCLNWMGVLDCSDFGESCEKTDGDAHCSIICEDECTVQGSTKCGGTFILTCAINYYGCFYWEYGRDCADDGLICDDTGGYATCGPCTPDCSGRQCGPDPVCGESCGTCMGATEVCRLDTGQCEDVCAGKECGTYEDIFCGACTGATEVCRQNTGLCEDVCAGKECGTFEGIYCGACAGATEICRQDTGFCEDVCANRECGTAEGLFCGDCEGATEVCRDGPGVCDDVCLFRQCGVVEGIDCGACIGATEVCREQTGVCEDVCLWRDCGVVEGIDCGSCPGDEICLTGQCFAPICDGGMCQVPAGTFWMGCNEEVDIFCEDDEYPFHEVYLDAYEIDMLEVTQGQYFLCFLEGICLTPECNFDPETYGDYPVECVTRESARLFCEWTGKRLCTEAEWEKAARGVDGRRYPWGNEPATCELAVMYGNGGEGCGTGGAVPVGSKPAGASPYGALDMSGNVSELVKDCYLSTYYDECASGCSNPQGPSDCPHPLCIHKGGDYYQWASGIRVSIRDEVYHTIGDIRIGFRCCR